MDLLNEKQTGLFIRAVTLCFLGLHLFFLIGYFSCGISAMAVVNLVCTLVSLLCLWLFSSGMTFAYMLVFYGNELVCLIFSVLFEGWSAGFQLPLVGLTLYAYLGEYLGRTLRRRSLPALPFALVNLAVFLFIFTPRFRSPGFQPMPTALGNTMQCIWNGFVLALIIAGVSMAVQMNSASERLLTVQAESDKLTGLYNRAGYDQLLSQLELHSTALLLVDADKFKHINDTFGHTMGDRVLKKIAASLQQNFRRVDYVCRIGGDEFVVLMLNVDKPEPDQIIRKANRINRELSHTEKDGLPMASVSMGVAFGYEAESWKELFDHADAALYQVKQNGGRDCRFYTAE